MNQPSRKLARANNRLVPIGLVALFLLAPWAQGQTITYDGDRGSTCASLPPAIGGSHTFTLALAIPAGSLAVISAATTNNASLGSVTDSGGNTWVTDNSRQVSGTFRTFAISSRITTGLAIGQTISLNYTTSALAGETSCAVISQFSNVTSALPRTDLTAATEGNGTVWTVTLASPTNQANELLHSVFATATLTGGLTINSPFQPLSSICSPLDFCVFPSYAIVGAVGTYSATDNSTNAVVWGGILTTYKDATVPVKLQRFHLE